MFWPHWRPLQGNAGWTVWRAYMLIVLCLAALEVDAVDITKLEISENGGVYHINLATVIDAPAEYVYRVLTDYVHIHRLHPSITQSDILPSPRAGVVRVRTRMLDCILIFCMALDRVEDISEVPPYDLHTVIVPSLSNFLSGKADWRIEDMGDRSQLTYEAQMEPNFPVIPVIGPYFVKQKLRDELESSLTRIECIAKIEEKLDWNPDPQASMVDVNTLCGQPCDSVTGRCPP
jgi:Polyketide cyclase / dehydrase and lipid transport